VYQPSRSAFVEPVATAREQDIMRALRLDRLAARVDAAEAALRALRADYDALLAARDMEVDEKVTPLHPSDRHRSDERRADERRTDERRTDQRPADSPRFR
jgi:hypothetical protein